MSVSTTKLALTFGFNASIAETISSTVWLFCAIIAASITRSPIPVERFAESITVIQSSASSSSAAIRITFPDVDILLEIEKHTISRPSSIYGLKSSIASVNAGADVFGVVLFSSDQL